MRRRARKGGGQQAELTIEAVGAHGDGFASWQGRPVFIPLTLAGDRVRVRLAPARAGAFKGEVLELLEEGSGRISPPCPHFGPCGGCALQHMNETSYLEWKQGLIAQALAHRGFAEVKIQPLIRIPPGTRRRATLAAARNGGRLRLGFHERASHGVVDLDTCLLMTPRLTGLLPSLRAVLPALLEDGESAEIMLSETEEGLDVLIVTRAEPKLTAREALAGFAETVDLARLSWSPRPRPGEALLPEPLAVRRPPRISFAGTSVEPPPGAFLQPTAAGEAALIERVMSYLPAGAGRVADLYAGCGTFTFPLATRSRVHAVESNEAALAALWTAARRADLTGRISVEVRNLAHNPVAAEELEGGDCVVFDPPRAGAKEQATALAASAVPVVIAVSCNPSSFARDARILVDGGYNLVEVTPVDQFPWSGHLELVAQFRR